MYHIMCDIEKYQRDGYIICDNVFSSEELDACSQEIKAYVRDNRSKVFIAQGISIPDFLCSHNDIGVNRIVGWHKDKLNGDVEKYQVHDIWGEHEGDKHEIVKVLTYLEDHSNDNDGLKLVPGSHMKREINGTGAILLHPKKGDVIIFDQRITHRGMERQCKDSRILVSMGFGKNNIFTDEFEKGTIIRQNQQNNVK